MRKYISGMYFKKYSRPGEISNQLIKLASPYVAGPLTYILYLWIEQNEFPSELKQNKTKQSYPFAQNKR